MSEAREQILANIRTQLGRGPLTGAARLDIENRLTGESAKHPIPARGRLDGQARWDKFLEMARYVRAQPRVLPDLAAVAPAIEEVMSSRGGVQPLYVSQAVLDLQANLPFTLIRGIPEADGAFVLTTAFAAVAETGTLVVPCGSGHGHSLNILGQTQIVLVDQSRILANYEQSWALINAELGAMPRALIWVTGPSRTGDIEQTMMLGAHGPKELFIFVIQNR